MPPLKGEVIPVLPVLYSFRRCPYAMRSRLALAVNECAVELREVSLKAKPAEMLRASPKGTVPVMVLPCGEVLDESLDIMRWAYRQREDLVAVLSESDEALLAENDTHFKCWLDRYKYSDRHLEYTMEHSRAKASAFIQSLEYRLKGHSYLGGASLGYLDLAIAPFVRQFARVDPAWFERQTWLKVVAWLEAFKRCGMFLAVMAKHADWAAEKSNSVVYSWKI